MSAPKFTPPVLVRCDPCLGMGYKGCWRNTARGCAWKLETCRSCGGRGEREPSKREQARAALVTLLDHEKAREVAAALNAQAARIRELEEALDTLTLRIEDTVAQEDSGADYIAECRQGRGMLRESMLHARRVLGGAA